MGENLSEHLSNDGQNMGQQDLEVFLKNQKCIHYAVPSSPDFAELTSLGFLNNNGTPLAVVRPQNARQVSQLIIYLVASKTPFTVRSGGNNLFGKSQVANTVCIDMRSISFCEVDQEAQTARIGGGIISEQLIEALQSKGVSTVTGMVPPIGYVGWASYGGYGPFSWLYGLGHEAIIGAKVVDWRGRILEADFDLLKGIRGAGGAFGVIVELTIKVHPLGSVSYSFTIHAS
jgi:FAD/FMN-containing dehydrogenase